MKSKRNILIKNKLSYLFILLLFVIVFIAHFFYFSRIILLKIPTQMPNSAKEYIYDKVKKTNFIIIETDNIGIIKKIFPHINIKIINSKNKLINKEIIFENIYYLTVDITNDFSHLNEQDEDKYFEKFKKNQEEDNIKFTKLDNLSIKKRILLRESDATPIRFYRTIYYDIDNVSDKKKKYIIKELKFPQPNQDNISLLGFAGDFVIEEFVKNSIEKNGYQFTLRNINKILITPDIMSVNNEYVISHRGKKEPKHFTFRASEEEASILFNSPIDYVSCANNHAMDYGKISLLDTIFFLDKYKIKHSGTGKNLDNAFAPCLLQNKKNKFAYYSICDVPDETNGYKVMQNLSATKTKAGVAYYNLSILNRLFKINKQKGYINVIQAHMGQEYSIAPSKLIRKKAHLLIDNGADVVICHHPHTINGVEIYKDKLIAYSLGDFLLDVQKTNADEGIILFLLVNNNKIVSWAFYPTVCHYGAVILDKNRLLETQKRFIKYTKLLLNNSRR